MLRRLALLLVMTSLAGCADSDAEAPMTIDGVAPDVNGTLEPDASMDAPGEFAPDEQVAPAATMEPSGTMQPDTTLTPR